MSDLGLLNSTGASAILRRAAILLEKRGWNKAMNYDPSTGQVDIVGALALAAGVKVMRFRDTTDPLGEAVPFGRRAASMVAYEALQWACDADPVEWQADPQRTLADLLDALSRAATRLEIGLLPPSN